MSRNRQETGRGPLVQPHRGQRQCDCTGCFDEGLYPAPRDRDNLGSYFWFCLVHIRAYNRAWNYYAGMSTEEIEAQVREDTVWQRPSWPLGARGAPFDPAHTVDPFGLFGGNGQAHAKTMNGSAPNGRIWRRGSDEHRALRTLDLEGPVTSEQIKVRYKELAKQHHPDANNGCKAAEERLKVINQAYTTLKKSFLT
jgi:hypothetical protein